jgi:prevent-host-death family protein
MAISETYVSIAEMKKRLSEVTNQVAYGGRRIILTSRGRPKAAIISMQDYEQLKQLQQGRQRRLDALETIRKHRRAILDRRGGAATDVDIAELIREMREERIDAILDPASDRR